MLTYRGDKFVKGKRFTINEAVYRYQKRDNKNRLVFESLDGKFLKLDEAEYNKLMEETNRYSEDDMINTIKAYYEDGNEMAKKLANEFVSKYAIDDKYPKLQAYIKKVLNKEHEEKNKNPYNIGTIEHTIQNVANEFGVSFDNKVPFEDFYAPDSDEEDGEDTWYINDYDWADFYDKILHDLGYGENPVLNDCRAEVHEVSDGKYTLNLTINGKSVALDLRANDKLDEVKDNVKTIIGYLTNENLEEAAGVETSGVLLDLTKAVKGYIEFELGMDDMDGDTAEYLKSLNDDDIKIIAERVYNSIDSALNEYVNEYLYDYKREKLDLPKD